MLVACWPSPFADADCGNWARRLCQYNVILLDTSRRSAALIPFLPRRRFADFAAEPVRADFKRASSVAMAASKRFFSLYSSRRALAISIVKSVFGVPLS